MPNPSLSLPSQKKATRKKRKKRGHRKGYSTGANAAAAARAATLGLVTGEIPKTTDCVLPGNNIVQITITASK